MYTFVTFIHSKVLDSRFDENLIVNVVKEFLSEMGVVRDIKINKIRSQERYLLYLDMDLSTEADALFQRLYENPRFGENAYLTTRFSNRLNQNLRIKLNRDRHKTEMPEIPELDISFEEEYRAQDFNETLFPPMVKTPGSNLLSRRPDLWVNTNAGNKRERNDERPNFEPISKSPANFETLPNSLVPDPFENLCLIDTNNKVVNVSECVFPIMGIVTKGEEMNIVKFSGALEVKNFMEIFNEERVRILATKESSILTFAQYVKKSFTNYNKKSISKIYSCIFLIPHILHSPQNHRSSPTNPEQFH